MAKEPTFRELHAAARAHQNQQPAPAIGDVDPGRLAVRGASNSHQQQKPAPAIGDVDPDAVEVRNARSRKAFRDMIASKEASPKGYDSYLNDYRPTHSARPQKP